MNIADGTVILKDTFLKFIESCISLVVFSFLVPQREIRKVFTLYLVWDSIRSSLIVVYIALTITTQMFLSDYSEL
jgi:hypothetical protein